MTPSGQPAGPADRSLEVQKRGQATTVYVSGGLGGLAVIGTGDLGSAIFQKAPLPMALFVTSVLVTAYFLALSFRAYSRLLVDLEQGREVDSAALDRGKYRRRKALVGLAMSVAFLLAALWMATFTVVASP